MYKIAVIIPFYNGDEFIKDCIYSLKNQTAFVDIYIINNCNRSTQIAEIIKSYLNICLINCSSGIGFGKACNIGADQAIKEGADYIVILNQDTVLAPNAIEELIVTLSEDEDLAIVAPIQFDYKFADVSSFFIKWYITQCPSLFTDALNYSLKKYYYVNSISGACFAIESSLFKRIGLFDPLYYMYSEDTDLCRRLISVNYKIALVPTSKIGHYHSNKIKDKKYEKKILYWQRNSESIYLLKTPGISIYMLLIKLIKVWILSYISNVMSFRLYLCALYVLADIKMIISFSKIMSSKKKDKRIIKKFNYVDY